VKTCICWLNATTNLLEANVRKTNKYGTLHSRNIYLCFQVRKYINMKLSNIQLQYNNELQLKISGDIKIDSLLSTKTM